MPDRSARTTYAWSISGDDDANLASHTYPPTERRRHEGPGAALLAAPDPVRLRDVRQYIRWSPTLRANWSEYRPSSNKALYRRRVAPGYRPALTQGLRVADTSEDGSNRAARLQLNTTAATVTVDLSGTGIDLKQTPNDLYHGGTAFGKITGSATREAAPYGFTMLEVKSEIGDRALSQAEIELSGPLHQRSFNVVIASRVGDAMGTPRKPHRRASGFPLRMVRESKATHG